MSTPIVHDIFRGTFLPCVVRMEGILKQVSLIAHHTSLSLISLVLIRFLQYLHKREYGRTEFKNGKCHVYRSF